MCDVQAARMVATCTADHFLGPSNFPGHTSRLPPPPWLPFSGAQEPPYFPSSWRTYSPLCSPRGAFLIQSWFLPLVTDYITGARKMNWGFLSCLDLLFKMAPHLLFPHSSQAIPLSQTHVQQSLSLAPRWGSGW